MQQDMLKNMLLRKKTLFIKLKFMNGERERERLLLFIFAQRKKIIFNKN